MEFMPHSFCFLKWKKQAVIYQQPVGKTLSSCNVSQQILGGLWIHAIFTVEFGQPDEGKDRVVQSFDGFNSYLLVADEDTKYIWVFLISSSKEQLVKEMVDF